MLSIKNLLHSRWLPVGAASLGFLEGSFVLFPMEPLFLPLLASRGKKAWRVAAYLLIGNVLGGMLMYTLGVWLAEPVLEPLVAFLGAGEDYQTAADKLRDNGFIALFLVGVTPFPFQLGAAAAGVVGYPFVLFIAAVTLSRGIRYFVLAGLVMLVGARAERLFEKYETLIFFSSVAIFVLLGVWLSFMR